MVSWPRYLHCPTGGKDTIAHAANPRRERLAACAHSRMRLWPAPPAILGRLAAPSNSCARCPVARISRRAARGEVAGGWRHVCERARGAQPCEGTTRSRLGLLPAHTRRRLALGGRRRKITHSAVSSVHKVLPGLPRHACVVACMTKSPRQWQTIWYLRGGCKSWSLIPPRARCLHLQRLFAARAPTPPPRSSSSPPRPNERSTRPTAGSMVLSPATCSGPSCRRSFRCHAA
mmetsp:Transcript_122342/g.351512  ORF Transcript_122342/g.351512 Transcript_122342/m.351512 type:complete len:232 (+) Transcript_122342:59-754(+)